MFQDLDAQWSKPVNDPDPPASPTTDDADYLEFQAWWGDVPAGNESAKHYARLAWITVSAAAREEIERLNRLAPLCEQHGSGSGTRSGCPYCALIELSNSLSRIDYVCGEPNEMECSGYDVHMNPDAVVEHVKKIKTECRLRGKEGQALATRIHAPATGYEAQIAALREGLRGALSWCPNCAGDGQDCPRCKATAALLGRA